MKPSKHALPGPDDVTRRQFDNGIVALVRENHSNQAVVIAGYLPVGALDETAGQSGLSTFTADCLMLGAQKRSFAEIYEAIESVGATLNIGGSMHTTGFGGKSLAEDLPLLLDVLADALQNPTFPPQEVERLRGQILTDLEQLQNNTRAMANRTFYELAYPANHPYSRSARGYPQTIAALTREDLQRFHQQGYGAPGMIIAIVGAVQTGQALAHVEAAFGGWRGRVNRRPPLPAAGRPQGLQRRQVAMPKKSQTDLVLGLPGPARLEPDYLHAALANSILGVFGLMGRLGERVRTQQGLAYYVYSQVTGGPGSGAWKMAAGVDPQNVERAVESIRDEIRRLRDALPDAGELADNQTFITGSLPLQLETNAGVAATLLDIELYGLGLDYLYGYHERIHAITAQDVQAAAIKWLDPDNLALGLAGPAL